MKILSGDVTCKLTKPEKIQRPFLNNMILSLGVNLVPRGEL
jgi:hypothetical protein